MHPAVITIITLSLFLSAPLPAARIMMFGIPLYLPELLIITSIAFLIGSKRLRHLPQFPLPLIALQSIMLLGITLSALLSPTSHGFGILKSWFIFPMLVSWIVIWLGSAEKNRDQVLIGWHGALTLVSVIALGYWSQNILHYDGRLSAFFSSPNQLALFLFPAPILSIFLLRKSGISRPVQTYLLIALLLSSLALFKTFSYTVWISVFAGLASFLLFHPDTIRQVGIKKIFFSAACALVLFLSLFLLTQHDNPKLANWVETPERSSLASRITIWKASWLMLEHHPFLGIGPGRFQETYLEYQRFFPPYLEWSAPEPHQLLLAFWLESGLIGLFGFMLLMFWWFRQLFQHLRHTSDTDQGILWLAGSLMLCILVQGLFDTPYWKTDLAYLFWVVIGLGIATTKNSSKEKFVRAEE